MCMRLNNKKNAATLKHNCSSPVYLNIDGGCTDDINCYDCR